MIENFLDLDKKFYVYQQDNFSEISWDKIFKNRRVLICSATRLRTIHFVRYLKNLGIYSELYKLLGIDQTYLITESLKFNLVSIEKLSHLTCLGDIDREFVKKLDNNKQIDNKQDSEFIQRFWNFQVLINDGRFEKLYEEPMNIDGLIKKLYLGREFKASSYVAKYRKLFFTPRFLHRNTEFGTKVLYNQLYLNNELKKYLIN